VTSGTAARATRAAKAAAVILTAVSCSVYDGSLLEGGPSDGGKGGTSTGARSGAGGEAEPGAGRSGSAGTPAVNGGSSGSNTGDGGMIEAAGANEAGTDGADGGSAGNGGAAGSTGGSSAAGTSGGGTSGGSAGGGTSGGGTGGSGGTGHGGSAGAGGAPPVTANGCAKLTVGMDDGNDRAHFVISLPSAADLTTGVISMRVYVQAGAAGTIFSYVQDSQYHFFGVTTAMRPLLNSLSGWRTLTFNVGAQAVGSTEIVKNDIRRIGIEINAMPDTSGWSNPTVVYVDSISVTTPTLSFPFDTAASLTTAASGTDVSGQVLWLHNGTSDTTATGVALAWQATCP